MNAFGWVDTKNDKVYGLGIPGMLSFLCFHEFKKPVTGLKEMPSDAFIQLRHPDATTPEQLATERKTYWPNVQLVFQAYHIMIGVGSALFGLAFVSCFFWWKGWLFNTEWWASRWLLIALVFSVLGPQICNQAGWVTAETGRQPWIVYNMLKTSEAVSRVVSANEIVLSLILFAFVYTLLFAVFIYLLSRKIQHGPETAEESDEMPQSWKDIIPRDAPRT